MNLECATSMMRLSFGTSFRLWKGMGIIFHPCKILPSRKTEDKIPCKRKKNPVE